jgi:hypothetical protein
MTIEQTIEIPVSRKVFVEVPESFASGTISVILTDPPLRMGKRGAFAQAAPALTPVEALQKMFGCCADTDDTLDAYMERHWAENDLERAAELRRAEEQTGGEKTRI